MPDALPSNPAYLEGRDAHASGLPLSANPYGSLDVDVLGLAQAWAAGWDGDGGEAELTVPDAEVGAGEDEAGAEAPGAGSRDGAVRSVRVEYIGADGTRTIEVTVSGATLTLACRGLDDRVVDGLFADMYFAAAHAVSGSGDDAAIDGPADPNPLHGDRPWVVVRLTSDHIVAGQARGSIHGATFHLYLPAVENTAGQRRAEAWVAYKVEDIQSIHAVDEITAKALRFTQPPDRTPWGMPTTMVDQMIRSLKLPDPAVPA